MPMSGPLWRYRPSGRPGYSNDSRGSGAVSACAAGEAFCGVVISAARDGAACSVALGGMLTAAYSGAAPALGWTTLTADGSGGVKAEVGEQESGVRALAVEVDTAGKYVTFIL